MYALMISQVESARIKHDLRQVRSPDKIFTQHAELKES